MLKTRPTRKGVIDGRTFDEMPSRMSNPEPSKKERLAMIDMIAKGAGKD